ncbi:hypothetical protein ABPG72_002235 [Tetrahymena utriculariae]
MKLVIKRNKLSSSCSKEIIGSSNASQIIREKKVALKVLRGQNVDMLVHEYQILSQLNHTHIIKLASEKPFKMLKGEEGKVGLKLELGHIDLFHFLKQSQPARLNTPTVKSIFRQLALALQYLHDEKQLAHNDIKLENILLFFIQNQQTEICPKLIDFGLASASKVQTSTIYNNWCNRSPNNLPPEIIEQLNKCCDGTSSPAIKSFDSFDDEDSEFDLSKCDVFQFGLTLFNALFLNNAFCWENGTSSYENFINNTPQNYWQQEKIQHMLNMLRVDSSQEEIEQVVDLFNLCFKYNPSERPSIKQILGHAWFV